MLAAYCLLFVAELGPPPRAVAYSHDAARKAVEKALPLLWKAVEGHSSERSCFTCHHHAIPAFAFAQARRAGFDVPADKLKELSEFVAADVGRNVERFKRGQGPGPAPAGGAADNTGHMLLALAALGHKPGESTTPAVDYLLGHHAANGFWRTAGNRPPTEASHFSTTALALRGLRHFGTDAHKDRAEKRVATARKWLVASEPKDTEDRVFRLVGLRASDAPAEAIRDAAKNLLGEQRDDGGWSQTPGLTSDAYATSTALFALFDSGGLASDHASAVRGLAFLLKTQRDDGSWHVATRSRPFQTYFETGFPHGKDQWVSCAATAWAVAALSRVR